jgi:hypothetical protein
MNKIKSIIFLSFIITLIGCDEEMFYDYIIRNNHDKTIVVEFETYDIPNESHSIDPGIHDTIYSFSIIEGTKIYEREIIFNEINIKSDTTESRVDYQSNDTWEYTKKSDTHAVYYLVVESEDFD